MPPKIDPAKFSEGKALLIYTDSQKYPRASVTNHLDGLTKARLESVSSRHSCQQNNFADGLIQNSDGSECWPGCLGQLGSCIQMP